MTEKTRTVVVIESHSQTIIRRSRRAFTDVGGGIISTRRTKRNGFFDRWRRTITWTKAFFSLCWLRRPRPPAAITIWNFAFH